MRPSSSAPAPPPGGRHQARLSAPTAGFFLLGPALALLVLSLVAAWTVPLLQARVRSERAAATVSDLRLFADTFKRFATAKGDWPAASSAPGELPAGFESHLPVDSRWKKPTPIGGRYMWAANSHHLGQRHRAAIAFVGTPSNPVSTDRRQLQEIDRTLDDGNLQTGRFQLGYRHQPVYVLEH